MKTKLILIIVFSVIGFSLLTLTSCDNNGTSIKNKNDSLSVSKNSNGGKYLTMSFSFIAGEIEIIDEFGKKSKSSFKQSNDFLELNKSINNISNQGYKLISVNTPFQDLGITIYIFEKE
ncbi:MAG: hypothetical protein ACOYMA_17755 [Bacteroidia bacterium]